MSTPEEVAILDKAAQDYADAFGKSFDEAKTDLVNLLTNMEKDPTTTALYFARMELAHNNRIDQLEARVAHLEEIGGGVSVEGGQR